VSSPVFRVTLPTQYISQLPCSTTPILARCYSSQTRTGLQQCGLLRLPRLCEERLSQPRAIFTCLPPNSNLAKSQSFFKTGGSFVLASSLETHDHIPFLTEPLRQQSVCNILSDETMSFFYKYASPSIKRTYRTYSMLLKILPFALYTSPLFSTGFPKQIILIFRILFYTAFKVRGNGAYSRHNISHQLLLHLPTAE
jgi:hypothetical protein